MKTTDTSTIRCRLFKYIAGATWGRVTRAHKVGVNLKEVGITADIVADILWYHKKFGIQLGVFAQEAWLEKKYGGDLDLFIEVGPDKYVWFALQAKLLKIGNIYDEIKYVSSKKPQWKKLKGLEKIAHCKPYYLLYNGNNTIKKMPLDSCNCKIKITQYGCSLVDPEIVEKSAVGTLLSSPKIHPTFEDFHPEYAQPWKILACCNINLSGLATYSLKNIIAARRSSNDKYKMLASFGEMQDLLRSEFSQLDNTISSVSSDADWESDATVIIPGTTNI